MIGKVFLQRSRQLKANNFKPNATTAMFFCSCRDPTNVRRKRVHLSTVCDIISLWRADASLGLFNLVFIFL